MTAADEWMTDRSGAKTYRACDALQRPALRSNRQIELLQMQSYPKFHNEIGVPIVRVGCREFECIGAMPPQDHHIYLNMGDASDIVCPYCSTLGRK
jgi:uncharacterized Zn-finger protein